MKTMLLLNQLNKLLVFIFLIVSVSIHAAETKWEVAIVFRGESEDEQFQQDIDKNILELARTTPGPFLKLGIYREMTGGSYSFIPNSTLKHDISLGNLLYRQDINQIKVPGTFKKSNSSDLHSFLKSFFKNQNSKKGLIIYSHGKGADGLRNLSTKDLAETMNGIPHLDLLWLDACFMANVEFLYELRNVSDYTIASEEAEFTSGLPFQSLALLTSFSQTKDAALSLSKNFIESYSYLKNGSQRNYVSVSSATISVIENSKLENLITPLKVASVLYKGLSDEIKNKLNKTLGLKASMDEKSLIDLGTFVIELRKAAKSNDANTTELIRLLNIESIKNLKTNPRVHIANPNNNSKLVYGFNNWLAGSKNDFAINDVFASILKNDGFIAGPQNTDWPYRRLNAKKIILTPFAPGINVFNYYFLNASNGKLLTESLSVSRTHDIVESNADTNASPISYTAYTQQLGSKAERYTGLNITMPGSIPTMDYVELEFNHLAEWLSL